jgi:hypothetical protein
MDSAPTSWVEFSTQERAANGGNRRSYRDSACDLGDEALCFRQVQPGPRLCNDSAGDDLINFFPIN